MTFFRKFEVWLVLFAIFLSSAGTYAYNDFVDTESKDMVALIIQFEGQPILKYKTCSEGIKPAEDGLSAHIVHLRSKHVAIKAELKAVIPNIEIKRDYSLLFSGMAIDVPEEHLKKLYEIPGILKVYEDEKVYPTISETVPMIQANDVWSQENVTGSTITGKEVLVSVIDSGIDYTHPDLGGGFGPGFRVIGGYDYINDDSDPIDDYYHGTHVAGIIGANGTKKGVAPDVKFLAYKVFDAAGGGGTWSNVMAAIEASADPDGDPGTDDGVDIISMSLGGEGDPDSPVCQIVDNAYDSGIIMIVSAGNKGPENRSVSAPACARNAIAVGAVSKSDDLAVFSSRGPSSILGLKPNVLAPGSSVVSTMPGGFYASYSGTSMAAPHVSGVAALVIQAHRDWNRNITRAALMNTALDLDYCVNWQGTGRINAYHAVNAESVIIPDGLSMGIVDVEEKIWYREETLKIVNTLNSPMGYDLIISMNSFPGVSASLNISHIDLAPYQTAFFKLNITLNNSQTLEHWYEGRIIAESPTENLSVPFFFIKENLTVISTPNPSNGYTEIRVYSPVDLSSLEVEIELPDTSIQSIPMSGGGVEWIGSFTVIQNGIHIINASSIDEYGNHNKGSALLIGDLIPPDFKVIASPDPADYDVYINITSNENISGLWFFDERITMNDGLESMYPELKLDSNDNLHMVWEDDEGDGKNSILYMNFDGETWNNKQIISDPVFGGHGAQKPKLVVDTNDYVHVIFHESIGNWYGRMYYCKINGSNGQVITPYTNISAATHFIYDRQFISDIAIDSLNRIHAVGRFYMHGEYAEYIVLNDSGTVLNYDVNVKADNIAIDSSDNIHIVYIEESQIYYYLYKDGMRNRLKKITDGKADYENPDLEADLQGNLHLLYTGPSKDIYYRKCYSTNFSWSSRTDLEEKGDDPVIIPDDSGDIHIVYKAYASGISYKKFDAIKTKWEPCILLSSTLAISCAPTIVIDSNYNLYVVWYDYRDDNNEEIYWARYRSSPYFTVKQPDGTNITLSMSPTDAEGKNFTRLFYPKQDGVHNVNATGIDLAGNIHYNTTSFEALMPPFVSDPAPRDKAHTTDTTPTITATLWDYSGVDISTVILTVNGTNVTSDAIITSTSINYTPSQDLWIGPIDVTIICADIYGNIMKTPYNWTFWIDLEPPSPTGLMAELSDDDIVLIWNAPESPDNNHYLIYKSFSPVNFDFSVPYHNTSSDMDPLLTTWTDIDAASNWTTRYYVVRVVDNFGKNDSNQEIADNCDWVVVGTQFHMSLDVILNGNLSVKSGGSLTLDNFTLKMNSTNIFGDDIMIKGTLNLINGSRITDISSNKYDLIVETPGYLLVKNSTMEHGRNLKLDFNSNGAIANSTVQYIERFDINYKIDIERSLLKNIDQVWISQSPRITNNTITECGGFSTFGGALTRPFIAYNNFINNGQIKIFWGSNPHLYNNTISQSNSVGIYIYQSSPIIERNVLFDNPTAFYIVDGSTPIILNSTIIGGDKHFRLASSSHTIAINTTFDRSKVFFDDATSSLTVKWYLHVFVRDVNGDPIIGASVSVRNVTGGDLQTVSSGSDGFVRWLLCTNGTINSTVTVSNDPHNVTVTKDTLIGYAEPEPIMNESKQVDVILNTDLPPLPPINLSLEIDGNNLILKWEASPSIDLQWYLIYRANSMQNLDLNNPWRNTSSDSDNGIIPLRTTWNDTDAAIDGNKYFYMVRAVDNAGQNDSNTNKVGKFVIQLAGGWNMISLPLIQKDPFLSWVLTTIAGKYDVVKYFNASDNKWYSSNSELTEVNHTMALWIYMRTSAELVVIGKVSETTSIQLFQGWNFIGYPCFSEKSVDDALSSINGLYDTIEVYDSQDLNDHWKLYNIDKPGFLNDLEYLKPGYGYWVYVTANCILTLSH